MASNQANDGNVSFGGRFPSTLKTGSRSFAAHLNVQNPEDDIGESHVYRQAIYEFYLNHWDELPEKTREELPSREWLKSKVDGGLGIDL